KAESADLISEGISMAMKVRIFSRLLFSLRPRVSELFDQLLFAPPDFIQLLQPVFLKGLERIDDRFGHVSGALNLDVGFNPPTARIFYHVASATIEFNFTWTKALRIEA